MLCIVLVDTHMSWGDGSKTGKGLIWKALAEPWGWILCSWDGLSELCSTEARGPNLCTHLLTNPWIQASPEEAASHWAKRLLLAQGSSVQPSASTAPCSQGSGRTGVSSLQPEHSAFAHASPHAFPISPASPLHHCLCSASPFIILYNPIAQGCGKFWKRWEYQTTWPASWEICMQVRKQQLEVDMEQETGSKSGKECIKAVYCHPAYLTYMQSTSYKCWVGWSTSWNQDCQEKYE